MKNKNLIILVLVLFALYYLFSKKETMTDFNPMYSDGRGYNLGGGGREAVEGNKKTKMCSQNAINDAYTTWTFGSQKFVR
jgi:hypothetical protein